MGLEVKGWITLLGIPESIRLYYSEVKRLPSNFVRKLSHNCSICEPIMRIMGGALPAHDGINAIARQFGYSLVMRDEKEGLVTLSSIASELFTESCPSGKESKHHLGYLAEDMLLFLLGLEEQTKNSDFQTLIQCLPHLQAYGLIEEMYTELIKMGREIEASGVDWPL